MNVLKYAAKLRKMSSDDISFRLRQKARHTVETFRWKMKTAALPGDLFVPGEIAKWDTRQYPFPAPEVRFFCLAEDAADLRKEFHSLFPGAINKIQKQTDDLCAHRFHFLGLDVELPDPIPWNQNPQTGKEYPLLHHAMMDTFNTERYGDVKFVWELNRHQFFIEVAKAYFLTGDEKYAEKVWHWLESWIAENSHKIGINHTSVLEHAVRIFSWVWSYYFTRESAVWTEERRFALAKNLLLQGKMIEENLSYYYSPYNHLIGELAALAFLGTVYGNSPKLRRWRDKYWQEMETQAEKQFHSDGFTMEQASYYHHFTLGFYLSLALLRQQNGLSVSPQTWKIIERAFEFPMYLTRPDGELPMLGDIDSARSLYFYLPDPKWNLRPFLALGATIFERGDMKFVAGDKFEEILWLLGKTGVEKYRRLNAVEPAQTSRGFSSAGYYILRDGWGKTANYCCFDCGDIAHGVFKDETPSAAHGHGDILSFELTLDGQPVIIDPGFHTYFGPLEWHRYLRSTRGHNAIEVSGAGQAVHEGRIGWSNVSSPQLEYRVFTPEIDLVGGSIDRFAGLSEKVFNKRYILFNKGKYFLVIDEVAGEDCGKSFHVESSLHFAPGELREDARRLYYNGKLVGFLALPKTASVQIKSGGNGPDQGWVARGYGEKEPAPLLTISLEHPVPVKLGMLFVAAAYGDKIRRFQPIESVDNIAIYSFQWANGAENIYLNPMRKTFSLHSDKSIETDELCVVETVWSGEKHKRHFLK
jgi:hypothetical protein